MENERKRKYYSIKKDGPNFHRAPSILCCLIEGGDLGNPVDNLVKIAKALSVSRAGSS